MKLGKHKHWDLDPKNGMAYHAKNGVAYGTYVQTFASAPYGYWKGGEGSLNDPAADSSGNGRGGSYVGKLEGMATGQGNLLAGDAEPSTSIRYTGGATVSTANWLSVPATADINAPAAGAGNGFSVSTWYRADADYTGSAIVSKRNGASYDWQLVQNTATNLKGIAFIWNTADGLFYSPEVNLTVAAGTLYHIVFSYQQGVGLTIYRDGVSAATNSLPTGWQQVRSSSGEFRIGGGGITTANASRSLKGLQQQTTFWKVPLTAAQVSSLYSAGATGS